MMFYHFYHVKDRKISKSSHNITVIWSILRRIYKILCNIFMACFHPFNLENNWFYYLLQAIWGFRWCRMQWYVIKPGLGGVIMARANLCWMNFLWENLGYVNADAYGPYPPPLNIHTYIFGHWTFTVFGLVTLPAPLTFE